MLGVCSSGAAKAADLYLTATKSDWFLPSLGELKLMYNNLLEAGVGGMGDNTWWSSTEKTTNAAYPFFWDYNDGQGYTSYYKSNGYRVRAVRYF